MQSKVPLPTDNIYKFYALFGLALFISATYLSITIKNDYTTNQHFIFIEKAKIETAILKDTKATELQVSSMLSLDAKERENINNYSKYETMVLWLFIISIAFMAVGFSVWQVFIQSKQNKLTKLNIDKINAQLKLLDQEVELNEINLKRLRKSSLIRVKKSL